MEVRSPERVAVGARVEVTVDRYYMSDQTEQEEGLKACAS